MSNYAIVASHIVKHRPKHKIATKELQPFANPTLFRQTIGSLQYLSFTRSDVAFAVNKTEQIMHVPTNGDWSAVKRILCFLKGTHDHALTLTAAVSNDLVLYSDANWVRDTIDHKSTTGYVIFYGGNPIS